MKKLMVALAAIALAGATQAATMSWSVLNMQARDIEAGWLVALYDSSTTFDYASAKDGTLAAMYTGTAYSSGTTIRANDSGLGSYSSGDTVSAYAVVFNAATIADATQVLISDVQSATVNAQGANISLAFGSMASTGTTNKFRNSTWADAPEPTSGLLMLVGFGALALRRRRA